jgi:hypothetical protein
MTGTEQDIHPLGDGGRFNPVAAAKMVARVLAVIVPALVASIGAYHKATSDAGVDAKVQTQGTKNKAEAGYQVTSHALEALEHRVLVLEQSAAHQAAARKPAPAPRGHRPTLPPAPAPAAAPVRPLPPNLDQAERQIARATPAPASAPASPDGGPAR